MTEEKRSSSDAGHKDDDELQSIRDAALEAEIFQHFKLAQTLYERVVSRKSNCVTAWESYGAFQGRRGRQDDAMACFDVALSLSEKMCVSASLRKAAILIDRNEIEFAVRTLSNIRVDEDGHDDLTYDEGVITNALYVGDSVFHFQFLFFLYLLYNISPIHIQLRNLSSKQCPRET